VSRIVIAVSLKCNLVEYKVGKLEIYV